MVPCSQALWEWGSHGEAEDTLAHTGHSFGTLGSWVGGACCVPRQDGASLTTHFSIFLSTQKQRSQWLLLRDSWVPRATTHPGQSAKERLRLRRNSYCSFSKFASSNFRDPTRGGACWSTATEQGILEFFPCYKRRASELWNSWPRVVVTATTFDGFSKGADQLTEVVVEEVY